MHALLAGLDWAQVVLSAIGAGLGTWFGAWAAFKHERKDRQETEHRRQGESLKRTLFILLSQRTVLVNIRDQHLAAHEAHQRRHIMLQPFLVASDEMPLDLEPLLFVLNTSDADLLNRLQVCNRSYRTIMATIDLRNELHLECQNLLVELAKRGPASDSQVEAVVGPQRWAQLKDFTDSLYDSLPRTLTMIDNNYKAVEAIATKEFPEVKLFTVTHLSP